MRPKPLADWRDVARYSWSVRLSILASVLGAIELGMALLRPEKPSLWFAAAAVFVSLGAAISRLFAQRKLSGRQ